MKNEKKTYKREDILNLFKTLAASQGFYGRLLRDLRENPEGADEWLSYLEAQNFTNGLDVILAVEGWNTPSAF